MLKMVQLGSDFESILNKITQAKNIGFGSPGLRRATADRGSRNASRDSANLNLMRRGSLRMISAAEETTLGVAPNAKHHLRKAVSGKLFNNYFNSPQTRPSFGSIKDMSRRSSGYRRQPGAKICFQMVLDYAQNHSIGQMPRILSSFAEGCSRSLQLGKELKSVICRQRLAPPISVSVSLGNSK